MVQLAMPPLTPPRPNPNPLTEVHGPRVLWLLVFFGKDSWAFEFPRQGQRVVTIGDSDECPVRVGGLPPVAFHIEREGQALVLVRGYPKDLRMNAKRVQDSVSFSDKGLVEFGRYRFVLYVLDKKPAVTPSGRSNLSSRKSSDSVQHDAQTRAVPAMGLDAEDLTPTENETALDVTGESGFDSTQVMGSMPDVDLWGPSCAPSLETSSGTRKASDTLPEGISLGELSSADEALGAPSDSSKPTPSGRRKARRAIGLAWMRSLAQELEKALMKPIRLLHHVGVHMQQHPLSTVLGSTAAAMLIPLVLLGLEHSLDPAGTTDAPQQASAASQKVGTQTSFVVSLEAQNDSGAGLAGVTFSTDGKTLGTTGASGRVQVVLRAISGAILSVDVRCPEPTIAAANLSALLSAEDGDATMPSPIHLVAVCENKRDIVRTAR